MYRDVNPLQHTKFGTIVNLNLLGLPSLGVKFSQLVKNVESDIKSNCVRESYGRTR